MEKEFMVLESAEAYQQAKHQYETYNKAVKDYCKVNKTNGIPVEICNTFPFSKEVTNEVRSAIEVWEFCNDIPEKYFLYIDQNNSKAITWTGQKLGDVSFGREFHSNFGDKRQSITVYGINGKVYYGTFYKGAGDYAIIKKHKHQ